MNPPAITATQAGLSDWANEIVPGNIKRGISHIVNQAQTSPFLIASEMIAIDISPITRLPTIDDCWDISI